MSLAEISVKRPTFITCIVLVILAVGILSMKRLGVDLFPDVTFPVVTVSTGYPGAGPEEIETLISRPLEDEISTLSGLKRLGSKNFEGLSLVIAEFANEVDVKYAEQQIRDRVSGAKRKLPLDIKEPVIRRIDPADQPVVVVAIKANLPAAELYDLANEVIRPRLQQVDQVGLVEVIGGRRREIQVQLDRSKLKAHEISVTQVAGRLALAGANVPVGKTETGTKETVYRTVGEFTKVDSIRSSIVSFFGSDVPTTVSDLGEVVDTLADEASRSYINGERTLVLNIFRQSGANTIRVVDGLRQRIDDLNKEMSTAKGKASLTVVRDMSMWIRANVEDVRDSILFGIALAVLVVYFFLGSGRSTIITGLALPNSLIGAFILMALAGYTINIMTLLALSLSVGLLIDDAIVVRENIFRHIEKGKTPLRAALEGTAEVRLAVIATTLTVIAVFGPVGFLKGVVGQFFKQFGITICFAMAISLFDALTIAPMLSAYFAGAVHEKVGRKKNIWDLTVGRALAAFSRFQDWLEARYERILHFSIRRPLFVLGSSFLIFLGSCYSAKYVPKTFLPQQDAGEFAISLDLPPGTNLSAMAETSLKADKILRENPEVRVSSLTVGGRTGEANVAEFYVSLVPSKNRKLNTGQVKEKLREQFKAISYANPVVKDYDAVAAGQRPFNLNILGSDQHQLEEIGQKVFARVRALKGLKDVDINYRPGKPEFQVIPIQTKSEQLGVSPVLLGQELRAQVEGVNAAKFRDKGLEYDIRVRLRNDQRDLRRGYAETYVPNINNNLVRLSDVARPAETTGPTTINRQDRMRFVQIQADIAPGAGLGNLMSEISSMIDGEKMLPPEMKYRFIGQAENFTELADSIVTAMGLGVLFIFLVLASLYESFITPLTIMLALPLAFCGSLVALAVTHESLNIFSMIGMVMLLGVATKNSILLVDYANQLVVEGKDRAEAMILAGKTRLRPILMTTMALIAGTVPIALGLNEASRQRTSMGIAIIGGLISSTALTLVVIPAAYSYIDRFRVWSKTRMLKLFGTQDA